MPVLIEKLTLYEYRECELDIGVDGYFFLGVVLIIVGIVRPLF